MEKTTRVSVAGGKSGWGGYVNRGNRFISPPESSDCQNAYDNNGVLTSRKGYTAYDEAFILCGKYDDTKSGAKYLVDSYDTQTWLSQEVEVGNTSDTGGDDSIAAGTHDIVVSINVDQGVTADGHVMNCRLYTASSGLPDALIKLAEGGGKKNCVVPTDDHWISFDFNNVNLTSTNFCIVLVNEANTEDLVYWNYSDTGYAPGASARKAGLYNTNAGTWSEIANVDFMFKVYFRKSSLAYKSLSEYDDISGGQYTEKITASSNTFSSHFVRLSSDAANYISAGMTMYWPSNDTHYRVETVVLSGDYTYVNTYPGHVAHVSGTIVLYFYPATMVLGTNGYIIDNHFNDWGLRISASAGNSVLRTAGFYNSLAIAPSLAAPQVWGTASLPVTGDSGAATFTGLTNPITRAQSVMWHKEHLFWGDVIINSVAYYDRIYLSGQTTGEAGYTDTRYISVNGTLSAQISVGDYAVISSKKDTYLLLGTSYATFELVKHEVLGGVINQEALTLFKEKVYGISQYGLFEIDRGKKTIISDDIKTVLEENTISGDSFVCPDYRRNLVIFSLSYYSGSGAAMTLIKKIYAYDPAKKTFWIEDIQAAGMTSFGLHSSLSPKVYGFSDDELWAMYEGTSDDGVAITAYYKTGPFYAGSGDKSETRRLWLLHGNESSATSLTVKLSNDYGTASSKSLSLYNSAYAENVPVYDSVTFGGRSNSFETEVYNATLDKGFKIGEILAEVRKQRPEKQG